MANGGGFWDDVDEYIECVIELCGFMLLVLSGCAFGLFREFSI